MPNESGLLPCEYNIVVRMDPVGEDAGGGERMTEGGIILPETKVERDEISDDEGTIVALSPLAFTYADWPEGSRIPEVGDRILMAQFDGRIWKRGGVTFRLIKDKSVIAVIEAVAECASIAA